jgi:hypothetical protein
LIQGFTGELEPKVNCRVTDEWRQKRYTCATEVLEKVEHRWETIVCCQLRADVIRFVPEADMR